MKRSHRILVALAAVLVLVWLLVRQRDDPHVDAQPTTASAVTPSELVDVHPPEAADAATDEDVRKAVDMPASEAPLAAPSEDTKPAPPAAWGRLLVVEEDGRETLAGDGVLFVGSPNWARGPGDGRVVVRAGAWRLEINDASDRVTMLQFTSALVDKRVMRVEAPTSLLLLGDARDLDVRVRRPARSLLRVIDAATKLDLPNVTLAQHEFTHGPYLRNTGPEFDRHIIVSGRESPIDVDAFSLVEFARNARLVVGAPRRAWQAFELDLVQGGERVIALAPGADLELLVHGVEPTAQCLLRVRRADTGEQLFACALARDDTLELTGLPAGPVTFSAEMGSGHTVAPLTLAELSLDLAPNSSTRAELELPRAPKACTAAVNGTFYASREWALDRPQLEFRSLEGAHADRRGARNLVECSRVQSERSGFDAFQFSIEAAPVGRCELTLGRTLFSVVLEVPPDGLNGVEFVLPPPAAIEFELLDAQTQARVAYAHLQWHSPRPPGVRGGTLEAATIERDGLHRIRAWAGEIQVAVVANGYEPYEELVRVAPGDEVRVIRLKRACTIEVSVRVGSTPLPLPPTWSATPTALDGTSEVLSKQHDRRALTLLVSPPGTYDVSPDPIPGYRTPAPQRVEVQRGAPVSIEFVYEVERP